MLMVKKNGKDFLAFITPMGEIELRDSKFNPESFEQTEGEVEMMDMRTFNWNTVPVDNFKNLLRLRINQCNTGLKQLAV
jgi:hypothetical protein